MIRFGTDEGRSAFDRVDPAHPAAGFIRPPAGGELAGIGQPAGHSRDQIALDRKDHIGRAEVEYALDWTAERLLGRCELAVAIERLPLMPTHLRKLLLQRRYLRCERG